MTWGVDGTWPRIEVVLIIVIGFGIPFGQLGLLVWAWRQRGK